MYVYIHFDCKVWSSWIGRQQWDVLLLPLISRLGLLVHTIMLFPPAMSQFEIYIILFHISHLYMYFPPPTVLCKFLCCPLMLWMDTTTISSLCHYYIGWSRCLWLPDINRHGRRKPQTEQIRRTESTTTTTTSWALCGSPMKYQTPSDRRLMLWSTTTNSWPCKFSLFVNNTSKTDVINDRK